MYCERCLNHKPEDPTTPTKSIFKCEATCTDHFIPLPLLKEKFTSLYVTPRVSDPDPGKNLHADPDPDPGGIRGRGLGVKGKNDFFF